MNILPRRSSGLGLCRSQHALKPFSPSDMKILLLEDINKTAIELFEEQGYRVEIRKSALSEAKLIEKIKDVHAIGINAKTKLTKRVLRHAKNLIVIGCFCIGTDQVDLEYATKRGIAVFNSPFTNSRSVAELVIAEIICLARQMCDRSMELHRGIWDTGSSKCWEVRGKTLGIIGEGHIGSQVTVLAEALGMNVIFYDIVTIMALGTAKQVPTLDELLRKSDFISVHVPETPDTRRLLSAPQFAAMKTGAYVINTSRGSTIDTPALVNALKEGKVAGVALDVYPNEPKKNKRERFTSDQNYWMSELITLPNVILTPHIGGYTEEAQNSIGIEVAAALSKYICEGNSVGSVNFPEVKLRSFDLDQEGLLRILCIYENTHDVMRSVNNILSDYNIEKQFSDCSNDIAYLITDISDVSQSDIQIIHDQLNEMESKISIRMLY